MTRAFDFLAAHQDYPWFLGLLLWLMVLLGWWRWGRSEPAWRWIGWSAAAGLLIAVIELLMLVTPVAPTPQVAPHLVGDLLLGAASALMVGGCLASLRKGLAWRVACALVAMAVMLARWPWPWGGNLALLTLGTATFLAWLMRLRGEAPWLRAGIVAAWLALALAAHGLLADLAGQSRRWMEVSHIGFAAAAVQLIAAALIGRGLGGAVLARRPSWNQGPYRRDVQLVLRWAAAWLVCGFGLSALSGWLAQRAFARSTVARVEAMARSIDPAVLEDVIGPALKLGPRREWRQPSGNITVFAEAPLHASPRAAPVREQLWAWLDRDPDIRLLCVRVFHGDEVILCLGARPPGWLNVERRITAADRADWAAQVADFRGMVYTTYDEVAQARAPILSADGRMLGWLVMDLGVSSWIAAQAQARAQTYLAVGLGLLALGFWCVQRWRERDGESALREAEVAQAAGRVKTAFLAKVSHELRTPLQSIIGYAEICQADVSETERRSHLDALIQHGRLLTRLVNDLIDLSAIESGALRLVPQPVELPRVLAEAARSLEHRAVAKGLAFAVELSGEPSCWVRADPERLRQIVLNLTGNAVKYTRAGSVRVAVACRRLGDEEAEVDLAVVDTGPGIPPDLQAELFRPFSRMERDAAEEGSGLGLAIAAGLCTQMGGALTVESDGRTGSTFRAVLRMGRTPAGAMQPLDGPAGPALQGKRILVADDNRLIRELFRTHLAALGTHCVTAEDGAEAWRLLQVSGFDAAVLDISMPGMDGLTIARKVRGVPELRRIRLIAASAHVRSEDRATALAAGFDEFLAKPFSLAELAVALRSGTDEVSRQESALRGRLREMFRQEAPEQMRRLEALVRAGSWPETHRLAHYLKNSAYAVEDAELMDALAQLEKAAAAADAPAANAALVAARQPFSRWTAGPTDQPTPLPGGPTPAV